MAEKYIKICGKLIAVSEEIYYTYYHMERQRRTQAEKEGRNRVASYDALDTDDGLGIDLLVDEESTSVEERVVAKVMAEKLHQCLTQLSEVEQQLIQAIYFDGWSEREFAKQSKTPYMTVHDRKIRALKRLKKMIDK